MRAQLGETIEFNLGISTGYREIKIPLPSRHHCLKLLSNVANKVDAENDDPLTNY